MTTKRISQKYNQHYSDILISASPIRKYIRRRFYINNILRFVKGKTIDFGCGAGEVLKFLPTGSLGLDPNQSSIKHCLSKKLNAKFYNLSKDKYNFSTLKNHRFQTFLMNHVLEHLIGPQKILAKIFKSAKKLGIERIIIVIPCKRGFKADETHVAYIDSNFFKTIESYSGYAIIYKKYYPINNEIIGKIFRYQELIIVYERVK